MKLNRNIAKIVVVILFCFSVISLNAQKKLVPSAELKSPIDLKFPANVKFMYTKPFTGGMIKAIYESLPAQGLKKEYMVQISTKNNKYIKNNDIQVDGEKYHLVNFHFHTPSEHMINGKRKEGEVHFVHKSDAGKFAVVGAFITHNNKLNGVKSVGGKLNKEYKEILNAFHKLKFPAKEGEGEEIELAGAIDVRKLLPLSHSCVCRYLGSKTSGTLDPGVKWIILTNPIEFSDAQLKILNMIKSSGTKIHPLNGRPVTIERCTASK